VEIEVAALLKNKQQLQQVSRIPTAAIHRCVPIFLHVLYQLTVIDADYYEPRAIVLSKMGQHKQALAIYVFDLQDYKKAEE
jgi:hypothetical protein